MTRYNAGSILAAVLMLLLGGCASRVVSVSTHADSARAFPQNQLGSVRVVMPGIDGQPEDPAAMPLQRRNVWTGVLQALAAHGFTIVSQPPADFELIVRTHVQTGERDGYKTVPVLERTYGTIDTDDGPRHFDGTTSTSVVVPQRERYVDRSISLTVIEATDDPAADQSQPARTIWIGRVRGSRSVIDENVAAAVQQVLKHWGETVTQRVRY